MTQIKPRRLQNEEIAEVDNDQDRVNRPSQSPDALSQQPSDIPSKVPGFLGSTSYSAVFTEGESHIRVQCEFSASEKNNIVTHDTDVFALQAAIVKEGAQILLLMSNMHEYHDAVKQWRKITFSGQLFPFVQHWVDNILTGDFQGYAGDNLHLLTTSRRIFLQTARALNPMDNVQSYFSDLFANDTIRWEVIGLMLTVAGLGAFCLSEVPLEEHDRSIDWKKAAKRVLSAGDKCILFFQEYGQLNDIGVWLILMNHILHTQVDGDAGKLRHWGWNWWKDI